MLGLYVKIPFHAQIRRADPPLAAEVASLVGVAATRFVAQTLPSDESFLLLFDEEGGCARLRAADAARSLEQGLSPLSPRLHGWTILLGRAKSGNGPEDFLHEFKRRWYRIYGDGVFIEPETEADFSGYLHLDRERLPPEVVGFPYAEPALPEGYSAPKPADPTLERFIDEVGSHCIGESEALLLLAIGPASAPEDFTREALTQLNKEAAASFLWMHAGPGERSPFGPILRGLASPAARADSSILAAPDRAVLEELAPVADFLTSSPYRGDYSPAIGTRFRLYVAARLRLYAKAQRLAGRPPVLVLAGLDRYPKASLALAREILEGGLGTDGLVLFGTAAEPPSGIEGIRLRIVAAPPPSPAAIADSALAGADLAGNRGMGPDLAALAEGDAFRLGLALRLGAAGRLPIGRLDTTELASAALATFPREFPDLVLALALAEDVLDEGGLEDFLLAAGFVPGLRPLLYAQLSSLGFIIVEEGMPPRLARPEAAAAAARMSPDGASALGTTFSERLFQLQARRRIKPSVALFRHIESAVPSQATRGLFYLDCVAADTTYGPSDLGQSPGPTLPLGGLAPFLAAYAAGEEKETAMSLQVLEASSLRTDADPLQKAVASLARAYDDYARGSPSIAATKAKPALMGLHGLGARRTEARAHRLLGLCAMAQGQVQEGADYLANAYELAEEVPDPLECILSAFSEAGALLVLGDLRRASQRGAKAAEWARKAFRADWESACDFLAGRFAFELGRYDEAAERFGRVRAEARVYDEPGASLRAELWSARSAAYAGDAARAREIFGRHPEDAESLWFLAELLLFEGDREEAARVSAEAVRALVGPAYRSADAVAWGSGYGFLEERAIGFLGARSYLADQVGAFAAFTAGLVELKPELVLDIALRTREERIATLHPHAHLYHYYCYLDLAASGGGPLDPATVLSKSFKALQVRTARMDEASLKNEYLEKNRWNREILAEARKHKLI